MTQYDALIQVNKKKTSQQTGVLYEPADSQTGRIHKTVLQAFTSCRWVLAYISCLGFLFVYSFRVNMSVAIVCMVKSVPRNNSRNISDPEGCGQLESGPSKTTSGEFDWEKETQGFILSSFFVGYIVTQIPGGLLAIRFGGKHVHGTGMLISGIASLLIPVAARWSPHALVFLRVVIGLGTGVAFPSMHAVWSRWAPPLERSKLIAFSQSGSMLGSIAALSLSGVLCATGVDGGWPLIFYVFGVGTCVWWLLWVILAFSSPEQHPRIGAAEKEYIVTSIGKSVSLKNVPTPWWEIAKSPPVWAICIAHVCNNWGNYTLITSLPMYMKEVLRFDIKQNGFLSALPYLVMFFMATLGGQLADFLRSREILSTTATRKVFLSVAFLSPAILMILIGFVSCHQRALGVVILTFAVAINGISRSAYNVNHVDIAPRFAALLYGLSNTLGTLPGIFAPMVVGILTKNGTREGWQKVFYICAAAYVFGTIAYVILGSGEVQPWADLTDEDDQSGITKKKTDRVKPQTVLVSFKKDSLTNISEKL